MTTSSLFAVDSPPDNRQLGLIVRSISIVILGVVFWGLAHLMVVAHEEPALEKRFGESFTAYTRQTNRWLPGLPRRA